jgi:hypothetical protein
LRCQCTLFSCPYTANALNKMTQSGPVVPTCDARGNMSSAGHPTVATTAENRLRTVGNSAIDPTGAPLATLTHDPLGRLSQIASTATTRFGYDGADMIAE